VVAWINPGDPAGSSRRLVKKDDRAGPFQRLVRISSKDPTASYLQDDRFGTVPVPKNARELASGFEQMAAFNSGAVIKPGDYEYALREEQQTLRKFAAAADLAQQRVDSLSEKVLPYYAHADQSALYFQRRNVVASKAIFVLSAAAVTIAVFQTLFFPADTWMISLEVLAMVALLVWLGLNRWQSWHQKWLHYRYLAEQLRTVVFTLILSEAPYTSVAETRERLPFYAGLQSWLLSYIRQVATTGRQSTLTPAELESAKRFFSDGWLRQQLDYHARNAHRSAKIACRNRWVVVTLFVVTLSMAVLHVMDVGHGEVAVPLLSASTWVTFFAIASPAWAAAFHGIGKQLEYERMAARSEQMAEVLERLAHRAEQATSREELRSVLQRAGEVIGLENYEWWVLSSFDIPEPG
jgi:hypothetical protein